jgi:hypothetical protein
MIKIIYLILVIGLIEDAFGKQAFRHPPRPKCQIKADSIEKACKNNATCQSIEGNKYIPIFDIPSCDESYEYRSIDGSCHNTRVSWFGMPETPFLRILGPQYDGTTGDKPRAKDLNGNPLPNSRTISLVVHNTLNSTELEW